MSVMLTKDEHEKLARAAYWEGYRSVGRFVREVMRKYMREREEWRGSDYQAIPSGQDVLDDDE